MIRFAPQVDHLLAELYLGVDLGADRDAATQALRALAIAHEWLGPHEILLDDGRAPFTPERAVAAWQASGDRELVEVRSDVPSWAITWRTRKPAITKLTIELPLELFARAGLSEALVAALEELARAHPCIYGFAHMSWDYLLGEKPVDPRTSSPSLVEVYWLNLLGPALVEQLGAERVRTTPAYRVDALPGGAIAIVIQPTPVDYYSDATSEARARALAHLRPDLDPAAAADRIRTRARALAPVERNWDPDIARLLEYTLLRVPLDQRRARERDYNALHPEVTEWLPASKAPGPELDDAEATALYARYAEDVLVGVHGELSIVESSDPEWLEKLDALLWSHHDRYFDTPARAEMFAVRLGAFVGQRMVKELGGRWIARRDPLESAVVLGGRAWLPFVRARHYTPSKDTVLAYSLMKFFREAERNTGIAEA